AGCWAGRMAPQARRNPPGSQPPTQKQVFAHRIDAGARLAVSGIKKSERSPRWPQSASLNVTRRQLPKRHLAVMAARGIRSATNEVEENRLGRVGIEHR